VCTTAVQRRERHGDSCAGGRADDQGHCPPVRAEDAARGRETQQECDADCDDQPDEHSLTHGHEYGPLDCRIASSAPRIMPSTPRRAWDGTPGAGERAAGADREPRARRLVVRGLEQVCVSPNAPQRWPRASAMIVNACPASCAGPRSIYTAALASSLWSAWSARRSVVLPDPGGPRIASNWRNALLTRDKY
jgi:hypothetical protein